MDLRFQAIEDAGSRNKNFPANTKITRTAEHFGSNVFNRQVMQHMLPKEIYKNLIEAMEGRQKIKPEYADAIALAMKEWAISHGATHYSHWFQPLTGFSAEKHDSFIDWDKADQVIERFNGKQLIQGEPDASSFPSGGLRSTYEARGYTGWDPASPPFLWKGGDGVTLCIPSVFFSWTGAVLDNKIPLLRSDKKINDAVLRLLHLTHIDANHVNSTLGLEQEYFVVDRALRNARPDLVLTGRTVFGAETPKGQELMDHYFAAVKDRILNFMQDFETAAIGFGIPVKTRHNEVAPAQHEVAPVFEHTSRAIDHNILLMELMRQTAVKHDLAVLLHEKPFHNLNGSGKHSNWSLSTDTGINLLDPSDTPGNNLHFLILLTAILTAVYDHSALLRASIGSAHNDNRLGGHEAPPAIISVFIGEELENVLDNIEKTGSHKTASAREKYDLGVFHVPELSKDNTDRNRTSPFAFTGNKFEFRAVGASSNPAFPITVLNTIVADTLNQILDEIESGLKSKKRASLAEVASSVVPVLQKYIKHSKKVRFSGDNYSEEWHREAKKRQLPNLSKSYAAFEAIKAPSTIKAFENVLNKQELISRYDISLDTYIQTLNIEAKVMLDLFKSQILPAAIKYQFILAESISEAQDILGKKSKFSNQIKKLQELVETIDQAISAADELETERIRSYELADLSKKAKSFGDKVSERAETLRLHVDHLEQIIDDELWPLPKYRELLFLV